MFKGYWHLSILFCVALLLHAVCTAQDFTFVGIQEQEPSIANVCTINWNGNNLLLKQCASYGVDFPGATGTIAMPGGNGAWVYNVDKFGADYNVERANALLEEAGWVMGPDGIRVSKSLNPTEPFVLDAWQEDGSGWDAGIIFSRNNDLLSRRFNPSGSPLGGNIILINNPAEAQLVTACSDDDYLAAILYLDQYYLQLQEMEKGRTSGPPGYYRLNTGIIGLDCGEITEDNRIPIAGMEYRISNNTPQTRPFIVIFNEDFTINKTATPLGPWTPTTNEFAYDQRFNSTIFVYDSFATAPIQKASPNSGKFPFAVIYSKRVGNTLVPTFQAINQNGTKRGGPKKLPLPAGVWRSFATVKFPG